MFAASCVRASAPMPPRTRGAVAPRPPASAGARRLSGRALAGSERKKSRAAPPLRGAALGGARLRNWRRTGLITWKSTTPGSRFEALLTQGLRPLGTEGARERDPRVEVLGKRCLSAIAARCVLCVCLTGGAGAASTPRHVVACPALAFAQSPHPSLSLSLSPSLSLSLSFLSLL